MDRVRSVGAQFALEYGLQTWTGVGDGICMLFNPAHLDLTPVVEIPSLYVARLYLSHWSCVMPLYGSFITIPQTIGSCCRRSLINDHSLRHSISSI